MEAVPLERFERECGSFDALVSRAPEIDRFCSASDWILSARAAWTPGAETWIRRGDAGYAVFLRHHDPTGVAILHSFDSMWGFSCPLAGPDPVRLSAEFVDCCREEEDWDLLVVTGLRVGSRLWTGLCEGFRGDFALYECGRIRRWQASLEAGLDGYLAKRSAKFRQTLRSALRKAEALGIEITPSYSPAPEALDAHFERILAIERRSWKGSMQTGLLIREMEAFYRPLSRRMAARGALRVLFARLHGEDVGYVLGGVLDSTYRGFQFSFDDEYAELSLGNVIQYHQIRDMCDAGIRTYDLGIDMEYKRRWAEEPVDTVSLAVTRA